MLTEGIYSINANAVLSSGNRLELQGDTNSVFLFNISGSLTLEDFSAILIGDVRPENIYWNISGDIVLRDHAVAYGIFISTQNILKTGANVGKSNLMALGDVSITNNPMPGIGHNEFYSLDIMKTVSVRLGSCPLPGPVTAADPNLVMNHSFEEMPLGACPYGYSTMGTYLSEVCHWFSLVNHTGSPDYFNSCSDPFTRPGNSVPDNFGGINHPAYTLPGSPPGHGYTGIIGYTTYYPD